MREHALDRFGIGTAICNPLTGGQVAVSETMGAAICSAVNDWLREHWLDAEPRLRASIVVPAQAPLLAAQEIGALQFEIIALREKQIAEGLAWARNCRLP